MLCCCSDGPQGHGPACKFTLKQSNEWVAPMFDEPNRLDEGGRSVITSSRRSLTNAHRT